MSRGQRFTFLAIAVVIGIVAIFVLADTSEDEPNQSAATATATPTPEPEEASPGAEETAAPTATPTPTPRPQPPLLTSGRVRELEFTEGDRIRFRVRSDVTEEIHVHCYDITRDVPAGRTITVSFEASITGICEIEFHNSGEPIGELRVQPR